MDCFRISTSICLDQDILKPGVITLQYITMEHFFMMIAALLCPHTQFLLTFCAETVAVMNGRIGVGSVIGIEGIRDSQVI
jgi:hypothetical protein